MNASLAYIRQAYNEGREAFHLNEHIDDNPRDPNAGRTAWFNGYLDARTGKRLRRVFKRNRIQWP